MLLESPYPRWQGLNLSWETLEGLAKHNGPVTHPGWAMQEADGLFPLHLHGWSSLEAQVDALAAAIAYDHHDIDDGLRAGLLTLDQLLEVPFARKSMTVLKDSYPNLPHHRLSPTLNPD